MGKHQKRKNDSTRRFNKWEGYYLEDCDCSLCPNYISKKKGCKLAKCCCEDEKRDAVKNGRIKRRKGWDK